MMSLAFVALAVTGVLAGFALWLSYYAGDDFIWGLLHKCGLRYCLSALIGVGFCMVLCVPAIFCTVWLSQYSSYGSIVLCIFTVGGGLSMPASV
jgi:uncharacterized membrane-anchored protein